MYMRPEIENLRARMSGMPMNKYQMALSKTEFVKLLDYVAELEQLRIHEVVGRSEQLLEEQSNWLMANTSLEVEKIVDFKEHFR